MGWTCTSCTSGRRTTGAAADPDVGWPGSVTEFSRVIGPLTDPAGHGGDPAGAFHVVCPSLPGYGFSGQPAGTGWNVQRIAAAWATLMARFGYRRYARPTG